MDIVFSVPDRLAERLQKQWGDLSERALQAIVANGYREEVLTLGEVREILGHSTRLETEQFLKDRGILLEMSKEELEEDAGWETKPESDPWPPCSCAIFLENRSSDISKKCSVLLLGTVPRRFFAPRREGVITLKV
jgi:predicted HTH domain antitoxin